GLAPGVVQYCKPRCWRQAKGARNRVPLDEFLASASCKPARFLATRASVARPCAVGSCGVLSAIAVGAGNWSKVVNTSVANVDKKSQHAATACWLSNCYSKLLLVICLGARQNFATGFLNIFRERGDRGLELSQPALFGLI